MSNEIITLPKLHRAQTAIYHARSNRNALKCGRRFGKTILLCAVGGISAAKSTWAKPRKIGYFGPRISQIKEPYAEIVKLFSPIILKKNETEKTVTLVNGAQIHCWYLDDNFLAGRGHDYDTILIDEAAYTKDEQMLDIWEKAILATTATRPNADFWIASTPNGIASGNFFHEICTQPQHGFKVFTAPSYCNPLVSSEWVESMRSKMRPDVFAQEIEAQFIDWSGTAFFSLDSLLDANYPAQDPASCDYVFAVLDTATKTGSNHDGTAVVYAAFNHFNPTAPVTILDWDYVQIEGALLETWLPNVFLQTEQYARKCNARMGSLGLFIEDKASGTILLQQAARRGWNARPIDSIMTSVGKDERAISVSGYVYQGKVKIAQQAFDKNVVFKEEGANHFLKQVTGYRLGQKNKQDDLFDCFCYAISIALGNDDGI